MRDDVTIYCIRHGETDWNAQSRYQGQADIPLNDKGRRQARRNGKALREFMPQLETASFVASPLIRTRETMELVRSELGLDPLGYSLDDRLREVPDHAAIIRNSRRVKNRRVRDLAGCDVLEDDLPLFFF